MTKTNSDPSENLRQEVARASREFEKLLGMDAHEMAHYRRNRLLAMIANIVSIPKLREIFEGNDPRRQRKLVRSVRDRIGTLILDELSSEIQPIVRGRKRKWSERDAQIYKLKARLSYGKIAQKLHIDRNAVQAAYRREKKRRETTRKEWEKWFEFFAGGSIKFPAPQDM